MRSKDTSKTLTSSASTSKELEPVVEETAAVAAAVVAVEEPETPKAVPQRTCTVVV